MLILYAALAVIFVIVVALLRSPLVKGWLGELQVNLAARFFLDKRRYHLLRNVTLPSGDGTTQIDHVIVSRYGIFVVETKNMSGWIFGTERDAYWTQKFRKSSYKFQNPLRQNYKHTETLAELLGLASDKIVSVVVFVGGAQIKKKVPANVTITGGYIRYIRSHRQEILSEEEIQSILRVIAENRLTPGLRTHRQHVGHVQAVVAGKATAKTAEPSVPQVQLASTVPTVPVCPKCGQEMILRTARKGRGDGKQFWGCPKFPKCRGVRPHK